MGVSGWIVSYNSCSGPQFIVDAQGTLGKMHGLNLDGSHRFEEELPTAYRFPTREAAKQMLVTSKARGYERMSWEDKEGESRQKSGDPFWFWDIMVEDHVRDLARRIKESDERSRIACREYEERSKTQQP